MWSRSTLPLRLHLLQLLPAISSAIISQHTSSSALQPQHTSAAPKSRPSYHHHPSSLPIDVCSCLARLLPLLSPSLYIICQLASNRTSSTWVCVPSTGKSSNSSSSSSCAAGFCGCSGLVVSLESETMPSVVAELPWAASDILGGGMVSSDGRLVTRRPFSWMSVS